MEDIGRRTSKVVDVDKAISSNPGNGNLLEKLQNNLKKKNTKEPLVTETTHPETNKKITNLLDDKTVKEKCVTM